MTDENYSGWTNLETWAAALWINNDEAMQELARTYAAMDNYGEELETWVEELRIEAIDGGNEYRDTRLMFADIGSLWRVNWKEIRDALLTD
jgi:hypothetical protein